ncbi:hypothetical protein ACE6H2_019825 [Prunus campanulata]
MCKDQQFVGTAHVSRYLNVMFISLSLLGFNQCMRAQLPSFSVFANNIAPEGRSYAEESNIEIISGNVSSCTLDHLSQGSWA